MRWTWFLLPSLLFLSATAVACDGDDPDGADKDDGVVLGTTPEGGLDAEPGDNPLADDLDEVVRRHFEVEFGDRQWVDDVGDIERDGETVTITMESEFDQENFDEACTAAVAQLMAQDDFGVEEVEVKDEDGDVRMRSRPGEPQCEVVAR